jgi:TonB-dependent receptor
MLPDSFRRILPADLASLVCAWLLVGVLAAPALAQPQAAEAPADSGVVAGRVLDSESGQPLEGVRVIVSWPAPADGSEPKEELQITGADGTFEFRSVPPGSYTLEGIKSGYGDTRLRNLEVKSGAVAQAELRMLASDAAPEAPPDVEEFVVLGVKTEALEASRQESDEMINTLSAAEISKYSASDIADVILRVPGVNVVEGQFAIIRGLEDRYSSTLYNSAPIPSPDPDRQSPQLDLFPSEIVSDLVVSKTFGPGLPSNSSGGSINVLTAAYPEEEYEVSVKTKGGWNDNAIDRFLSHEDGTPVGDERDPLNTIEQEYGGTIGGRSAWLGREVRYRVLGNWGVNYGTEVGFQEDREPRTNTANPPSGDLENGELSLSGGRFDLTSSKREEQMLGFGAFGFDFDQAGNHGVDVSLFWTKKDDEEVQLEENGFFPDLDYLQPNGPVDLETQGSSVDFDSVWNGTVPGATVGNATLSSWIAKTRSSTVDSPSRGPLWFSSFMESKSFEWHRDLLVPQINGRHAFDALPGFELRWVGNYAGTSQKDSAYGARMRYEPCGFSEFFVMACPPGVTRIELPTRFPTTVGALGPGKYVGSNDIFVNDNDIEETQWFGRADGDYETDVTDWLLVGVNTGGWYEYAERDVKSSFLEQLNANLNGPPLCPVSTCDGEGAFQAVFGDTLQQLGRTLFNETTFQRDGENINPTRLTDADAKREIQALNFGGKTTFWEDVDLLAGLRLENIYIESNNDPFQDDPPFDIDLSPSIYPSKYLFFDRFGDNPARGEIPRPPPFNDEILGLKVALGPCRGPNPAPGVAPPPTPVSPGTCVDLADRAEIEQFLNGEIDETKYLPSAGVAWRPIEGLALRAAWSQTVARPSFRELLYYVSVEPASDDLIVGNPQLQLSDVESWDARAEYVYGDYGDLFAVSAFYKTIEDPIESIIVRNPSDFGDALTTALFRTFFNNPNEATLWGVELEARKNFGFLREAQQIDFLGVGRGLGFLDQEFFEYLTIGSNFTWIDATVDRTDAELQRSIRFFPVGSGKTLDKSRRLYGQPEWMVNADISFDHPDWGSSVTLAFYAISDVLDAAGAATIGRNAQVEAITLDRYVDSFHTLDLIVRQELWSGLAIKLTAKNLTDSRREIVYDPAATSGKFTERSYHVGRDYTFELSYTFSELPFLPGD